MDEHHGEPHASEQWVACRPCKSALQGFTQSKWVATDRSFCCFHYILPLQRTQLAGGRRDVGGRKLESTFTFFGAFQVFYFPYTFPSPPNILLHIFHGNNNTVKEVIWYSVSIVMMWCNQICIAWTSCQVSCLLVLVFMSIGWDVPIKMSWTFRTEVSQLGMIASQLSDWSGKGNLTFLSKYAWGSNNSITYTSLSCFAMSPSCYSMI